jgi:hypothetical protein
MYLSTRLEAGVFHHSSKARFQLQVVLLLDRHHHLKDLQSDLKVAVSLFLYISPRNSKIYPEFQAQLNSTEAFKLRTLSMKK